MEKMERARFGILSGRINQVGTMQRRIEAVFAAKRLDGRRPLRELDARLGAIRRSARSAQTGKQQRRQNTDHGDNGKEFDQSKSAFAPVARKSQEPSIEDEGLDVGACLPATLRLIRSRRFRVACKPAPTKDNGSAGFHKRHRFAWRLSALTDGPGSANPPGSSDGESVPSGPRE